MIIGVPKEIKPDEYRVGLLPVGVDELVRLGHEVLVENDAGLGSGIADEDYLKSGAEIVSGPEDVYGRADMVIKVKEPQASERAMLRRGQIVFTYFHFAADRQLTDEVLASGCIATSHATTHGEPTYIIDEAAAKLPPIARAINMYKGSVTNRPVAETFGLSFDPRFAV